MWDVEYLEKGCFLKTLKVLSPEIDEYTANKVYFESIKDACLYSKNRPLSLSIFFVLCFDEAG